mmetsp:Transcript_72035/g.161223  ORF Transcript_72035/g.161223 Transcript_72035/m.161223 type:complete len:202 (+) Transcript_72035:335-940(+)
MRRIVSPATPATTTELTATSASPPWPASPILARWPREKSRVSSDSSDSGQNWAVYLLMTGFSLPLSCCLSCFLYSSGSVDFRGAFLSSHDLTPLSPSQRAAVLRWVMSFMNLSRMSPPKLPFSSWPFSSCAVTSSATASHALSSSASVSSTSLRSVGRTSSISPALSSSALGRYLHTPNACTAFVKDASFKASVYSLTDSL